jgi:DNA-binding CsgD family transcriptional regulator
MADDHPLRARLLGRRSECDALDRLVAGVRAGQSQVLVLRGEAGVGKTALLEYLVGRGAGCRIARAAGVESEMELPFAGLHQLCSPLLDRLPQLPAPQGDALRTAFGLSAGEPPDRFLVALAVLSLLAEVAEEKPLLCVIDDAQWLDLISGPTLSFVARRLLAERVGLVFAVREPSDRTELAGLPDLAVRGLIDGDARALLDSVVVGPVDERVRDRIVAETRGNPLALMELPRGLTPAELAGGFGLPDSLPLAGRIGRGFLRRLESLPADSQRLVLAAAADPVGDATLLWRALERLGIGEDAAAPAEAAGLIELGARVRFRHPIVRSTAYRAASARDRQAVHRALAEATDPEVDPERRAWHRAHAAVGPDEAVAAELEALAARAQSRGGIAAAAAFLARGAELTPDPVRRGTRALAAAQAKFDSAAPAAASELLATADIAPLEEPDRACAERLRAQIAFTRSWGADAVPLLRAAAERLEPVNAGLARETYLEAFAASIFAGRLGGAQDLPDVAAAALTAPAGPAPPRAADLLLDGLATRYTQGYAAGLAPLRRAVDAFTDGEVPGDLRWFLMAWPSAFEIWDDGSWERLTTRAVTLAREAGALTVLPVFLAYRAVVDIVAGAFAGASVLIAEADAIVQATGNTRWRGPSMLLAAWRGQEETTLRLTTDYMQAATARGEGRAICLVELSRAILYTGLGRYPDALAAAQRAYEYEDFSLVNWMLPELVEAAARSERPDVATTALGRLEERARAAGTDWALGILARSRALAGEGDDAEPHYREAIERLARTSMVVQRARTQLVYGEWLRRQNRRTDAREQLRPAHEFFRRIGAEAFAERAERELLATGETIRRRTVETYHELTAQELQVARLAVDGRTNPEIGAQLFISPRTVEYHLRKVFAKFDISSRKELRGALRYASQAGVPVELVEA